MCERERERERKRERERDRERQREKLRALRIGQVKGAPRSVRRLLKSRLHRPGKDMRRARKGANYGGLGAWSPRKFEFSDLVRRSLSTIWARKFARVLLMRCAGGARSNQAHRKREWLGVARYTAAVAVTLALLLQHQPMQQ